ncbi:hypothetical protein HanOQP8_Chr17g0677931 [Helianthus annuus]|nr:hypothetical protein HanOQP8_Chr17g0677931 [Helianthus annuus]
MVAGFMNFSNQATLGCGSPATTWGSGDEPGALVKTVRSDSRVFSLGCLGKLADKDDKLPGVYNGYLIVKC